LKINKRIYMKLIQYILLASLLVLGNSLFAQTAQDSISVELNKTIIVTSTPTVQLSDVVRISENPKAYDTLDLPVKLNYSINTKPVSTAYEINTLKAVSVTGDKLQELYRGEVALGAGNYATTYANVRYMTERSRVSQKGVDFYHYASAGKVMLDNDVKAAAGYSEDYIGLHVKKFNENYILSAAFKPNLKTLHLYGYETDKSLQFGTIPYDSTFSKKETSRKIFTITTQGGIASRTVEKEAFKHTNSIIHNVTFLNPKRIENAINVDANGAIDRLNMTFGYNADIEWSGVNFTASNPILDQNQISLGANPFISKSQDNWSLRAGILFSQMWGVDQFKVYPDIQFEYDIKDYKAIPFIKYSGKHEMYTMNEMLELNSFVSDTFMLAPTNYKSIINLGIKGRLSKTVPYKLSLEINNFENMYFWYNDAIATDTAQNTFTALYDNGKSVSVYAETGVKRKFFDMILSARYTSYTLDVEEHAWHKPGFEAKYKMKYNIINPTSNKTKLTVRAEVFYDDGRYAKDPISLNTKHMNGVFDCNVGLEYFYNSTLVIFFDVNNITGTKYQEFYMYPSQRINALIGAKYSFGGVKN